MALQLRAVTFGRARPDFGCDVVAVEAFGQLTHRQLGALALAFRNDLGALGQLLPLGVAAVIDLATPFDGLPTRLVDGVGGEPSDLRPTLDAVDEVIED